jgi:guanine deaminase
MNKDQKGAVMDKTQEESFMHRAIELSERAGIKEKSGGVFGAVIVKDGKIIAEGYNQVAKTNDPTWHAEMHAIREACKKLGTPHLEGCTLYTSSEPCPMCLATAYWAHIDHIYFGARVQDAAQYGDFQDEFIYKDFNKPKDQRKIKCTELLREDAKKVWEKFSKMSDRARY